MRTLFRPLLGAFLALGCASAAMAQSASSIPVKNANGSTVSVAGQNDTLSAFHYRDVMEGLQTDGTPTGIVVDSSGRVSVNVITLPSVSLNAGSALIGGVKLYDAGGTNQLAIDSSGRAAIQAPPSLPLPTGAASAANQPSLNGDGGALAHVTNWPAVQPVSAADGQMVTEGSQSDSACSTDTGTCTEIALLKRELQRLTTLITNLGSPFQAGGSIGNSSFAITGVSSIAPLPVGNANATPVTVTISNGTSLSAAVDLGTTRLARIAMPASWTAAVLTFQTSPDGVTYNDLYDSTGSEYTVTAAANHGVLIPIADFLSVRYLKIRSGTSAVPVNQGADRTLSFVVVP